MFQKNSRQVLSTFLVGLLVGAFSSLAMAASGTSGETSFGPVYGYSYKNWSFVTSDWNVDEVNARTTIGNSSGGSTPAGYMGVSPYLYYNNTLCSYSGPHYSPSSTVNYSAIIGANCGNGTYHSNGITYAYNGSGYDQVLTNVTPYITY